MMTASPNPFVLPHHAFVDRQVLCPWRYHEHEALYVPVNSFDVEYARFQTAFGRPGADDPTPLVLVGGGEGCGKTAFVNRCVDWIRKGGGGGTQFQVMDLTGELRPGADARVQIEQVTRRLIDMTLVTGLVRTETDQQRLEGKAHEPHQAIPFLADLLRASGTHGLVVVPVLEVLEAVRTYASLARPGITLFCETPADDVYRAAGSMNNRIRILPLRVGPLQHDDGWLFIASRLARSNGHIKISKDTADRYMEARMSGRGTATIRELELACCSVYEEARGRRAAEITFSDFQDYYLRRGVLQ